MTHVAVVQKSHHFRHPVSANSVRLAGTLKRLQDLQLTKSHKPPTLLQIPEQQQVLPLEQINVS